LGYGHLDVIPVDSTLVIHIIDPVTKGKAIVDEVTMGPMVWAVLGGVNPRIDVLPLWGELNRIAGHEGEEHVLESLPERRVVGCIQKEGERQSKAWRGEMGIGECWKKGWKEGGRICWEALKAGFRH
ncbi:hypothetical protein Taro_007429, partial [Colocasia esculenta]|nr:hypothetical protein [Colocasia esculenta]